MITDNRTEVLNLISSSIMLSQKCSNFVHFYLLGPYYVLEDNIGASKIRNLELGDHTGEVAVITGGHRGIGAEVTKELLKSGMHVILGCRNIEDGNKFVNNLRENHLTSGKTTVLSLDLSSLETVREFAKAVLQETSVINFMINNAGIILSEYKETTDQMDSQWQVNYLSHFLLCHLLLPTLQVTPGVTKIVNVSSLEHKAALSIDYNNVNKKESYDGTTAYAVSKLAQVMFTLYLNENLKSINSKVEVVAAHPGIVNTEIFDDTPLKRFFPFIPRLLFKTPEQGAKPIVYAALFGKGGQYIGNCVPQSTSTLSQNAEEQQKLFNESKKCLHITLFGDLL